MQILPQPAAHRFGRPQTILEFMLSVVTRPIRNCPKGHLPYVFILAISIVIFIRTIQSQLESPYYGKALHSGPDPYQSPQDLFYANIATAEAHQHPSHPRHKKGRRVFVQPSPEVIEVVQEVPGGQMRKKRFGTQPDAAVAQPQVEAAKPAEPASTQAVTEEAGQKKPTEPLDASSAAQPERHRMRARDVPKRRLAPTTGSENVQAAS